MFTLGEEEPLMNHNLLKAACVIAFLAFASPSYTQSPISALTAEMEKEFNAGNFLAVAGYYRDSAYITGGRTNVTGRENLDAYWKAFAGKKATWRLETDSMEDYGAIILHRGRSYLTTFSDAGQRQSNVRFLLVWKKTGDSYKVLYDYYGGM